MNREIVVTGVGAVTPLGVGARTLYERWRAGASGIQDGVGAATEYEPTEHLSIKEARRSDRFSQFAMVASDEALAEAGWKDEIPYDVDRVATLIGTGIGGIGTLEANHKKLLESGPKAVSPLSIPLSPAHQRSWSVRAPTPSGVTAPTPVMTTRRCIRLRPAPRRGRRRRRRS
jgi:3-oxoacyl-[acyl-carrier-protein] synthase II